MLSAVVVLDGWGAGSLTSNFHPKLTWVAHCVGYTRGILYSVRLQGCFDTRCSPSINMHLYSLVHTHTHLIVDSVRCVHVWCPLQNTRLAILTDLLQSCKVVSKSGTAVFTGGGRACSLLVCAQGANCTDRQTDRRTDRHIHRKMLQKAR